MNIVCQYLICISSYNTEKNLMKLLQKLYSIFLLCTFNWIWILINLEDKRCILSNMGVVDVKIMSIDYSFVPGCNAKGGGQKYQCVCVCMYVCACMFIQSNLWMQHLGNHWTDLFKVRRIVTCSNHFVPPFCLTSFAGVMGLLHFFFLATMGNIWLGIACLVLIWRQRGYLYLFHYSFYICEWSY